MLTRFTQFINDHSLCNRENTVLLAVSGGMDSMVMVDLFLQAGFRIVVVHVNFQLRGAESERDHDFIAAYCAAKGVAFHSTSVNTNNYATSNKLSTQMAARELRYEWFYHLLDSGLGDVVATAHHLNDSVETIILNLLRGSGTDGLTGIPVVNDRIIRPLMFATRVELEDYAASRQVVWREDESNQSIDYQRNIVRQRLVPVMRLINPALEQGFQRTMTRAMGEEELIQSALGHWMSDYLKVDGDHIRIDKRGLDLFKHGEAVLLRLTEPYGFNLSQCIDALGALHEQSGKVFYSATHQLVIDRTHLIITKTQKDFEPVAIASGEELVFGPFKLAIHEQEKPDPVRDSRVSYLDKDKVNFPLQWRTWKEGDYFFPLGLGGRKKVSDFLIDLKLSLPDKQSVTVIESGSEIVCLPGFRIDDRFKVTDETRTALVLEIKRT